MNLRGTRRALLLLAAAAGVASILAVLAPLGWWLELFSHFRVQYAVVLLLCGVALLWLKPRLAGLASLALALFAAAPLAPYRSSDVAGVPGSTLDVVVANVWFRNDEPARLLEWLADDAPDVIVMLEATPRWRVAIAEAAAGYPWQVWSGGILVISRVPLDQFRVLPFGGDRGAHGERSDAVLFSVRKDGARLGIVAAHTHWPLGRASATRRNAELAALAHVLRFVPGPRVLLGDLNTTPFSPQFARLERDAGLVSCSRARGWHPTWPALFPPLGIPIDHCLRSAEVRIDAVTTGPYVGSDHYPLRVRLRLPQGEANPGITAGSAGARGGQPCAGRPCDMPPVSTIRIASSTLMSSGSS